jgi:hypothetical protein
LFTQGVAGLRSAAAAMDTETEEDESDLNESKEDAAAEDTFSRGRLAQVVRSRGGIVLDEFPGERKAVPSDVIVLSDRHCKTMTYLLAVAYGFPRVNFLWVRDCLKANKRLPLKSYMLPVGVRASDDQEVECHDHTRPLTDMLANKSILLASTNGDFAADWTPLLTRLGASVSARKRLQGAHAIDLVMADRGHANESLLVEARSRGIPVVTPAWIIQSIICGHRLTYGSFAA